MAVMNVSLVAVDRHVWDGEATRIIARTVEGDIGILPGHEPFLGLLADGRVRIERPDDYPLIVAVHEGFFSVDSDNVKILAEIAELATEIDLERAERAKERAEQGLSARGQADDAEDLAALRRAETRIDVAMRHERIVGPLG